MCNDQVAASKNQRIPHILCIVVVPSKVGQVIAPDTSRTAGSAITKHFRLKEGDVLQESKMREDLMALNRNPFRTTSATFAPGKQEGTTDIYLMTQDRPSWRPLAGIDNTGPSELGQNRWYAGLNIGNLWWLNHLLTVQFIASMHMNRFKAVTAHYTAPLPNRQTVELYGGCSWVRSPFSGLHAAGKTAQGSLRYEIPFAPGKQMLHLMTLGADFKMTNNTLEAGFDLPPLITSFVNLFQLMGGYRWNYETSQQNLLIDLEIIGSPAQWLPHQSRADYESLRSDATPTYVYGRAAVDFVNRFQNGLWIYLLSRAQISSNVLLPSETLSLGGADSVRGYLERVLIFDWAAIFNLELRSPIIHPIYWLLRKKTDSSFKDQLYFLAFIDYGLGRNCQDIPFENNSDYLLGVGPGVRYDIDRNVSFACDWGFKIHRKDIPGPDSRVHFSLVASY